MDLLNIVLIIIMTAQSLVLFWQRARIARLLDAYDRVSAAHRDYFSALADIATLEAQAGHWEGEILKIVRRTGMRTAYTQAEVES